MLHIHNGDSSADTAKQSSLAGEHLAFRESLITGPTPSGLSGNEWRSLRAAHLSESYGANGVECERGLLRQEEKLASFSEHEEVVLWFEHDLFCQLHLIYLLDWFSQHDLGKTKLSLICVDKFPGKENFRGLGELTAGQLATLFPERQRVTSDQINLAVSAWQAYRSSDPIDIEKVLQGDLSTLPFLRAALSAHLERFPSTKNGLGRIESRGLEFIAGGLSSFIDLFSRFADAEPRYGLGDAQFWLALHRMKAARESFVQITGTESVENGKYDRNGEQVLSPEVVRKARLEVTALGELALKGEADFVNVNGIDFWLGGVHLNERDNLWRWDEESRKLVSFA